MNKLIEGERVKIGLVDYVWKRTNSKWSCVPDTCYSEGIVAPFSVCSKTLTASDGSSFDKPMSMSYINNIRSRTSKDNKFKTAGSYGADIRR